ncbi:MAG: lanthionine synthetase LanC family protein, partial [Gaiellaceae bacterium]
MLYSPKSHEPLVARVWNRDAALAAIREIAADCATAFDAVSLRWPMHPRDVEDGDGPYATVYLGSAGVVYALDLLAQRGLVGGVRDYVPALEQAIEAYRAAPEFEEWAHPPSLWMGETGILLTLHRLAPSSAVADRIAELVAANADGPHREFMWGSPGTMLAARGIERPGLWRESAERLRGAWEESGLWTQEIYGGASRYLGPAHGFAGCVAALVHRPDGELHRRAGEVFKRFAIEEDGLANWPPLDDANLVAPDGAIRVQWCHGAPGMVAC